MSFRRRLALACGTWLVCCTAHAAAVDTLDACAAQASSKARGVLALEIECPGLEPALRELGFIDILPDGWRDTLNRDALLDLESLAHRYLDAPAQPAPDPGALRAVLDQLQKEQVKPARSWWDVVRERLASWLEKRDGGSGSWLDRLLQHLDASAGVIKAIVYLLLALLVVAAILLVVNELRAAGVLSRRREGGRQREAAAVPQTEAGGQGTVDLDALAPRDQAAALLRLLVARLLANGQLHAERCLTHRELVTHSAFSDPDSRVRFERVTQLAERVLYGSADALATQAGAVIADGRRLLLQWQEAGMVRP